MKSQLKKEFANDHKKFYSVELFKERGFVRKKCKTCGNNFWTLSERETCPSPPCSNYTFIGKKNTRAKWNYVEAWKKFERFFEKNGHTSIKRYPVIDRWRPDLFFTIASIQDFQRIDNGKIMFEYPENPLIVPQMCLRFNDISNVGVTGRHHTSFMMSGQHAFGFPKEGYWKDKCLELNFKLLTKEFGINEKEIAYIEDAWAMPDLSAFGPCIETFSKGLEIVNSVFMQFTRQNGVVKDLPLKVIDVGWGHERLVWFSNLTSTGYEAAFGNPGKKIIKDAGIKYDKKLFDMYAILSAGLNIEEAPDIEVVWKDVGKQLGVDVNELRRNIEPLQACYAIADHTKTLLFAISDGGIPSNVGGGYNLRLILRRAFNLVNEFQLDLNLSEIMRLHAKYLKPMFPELINNLDSVNTILDIEEKRYKKTLGRSKKIITDIIQNRTVPEFEEMKKLYESDGITPEMIESAAKKSGIEIRMHGDFYKLLSEEHDQGKNVAEEEKIDVDVTGIPETKMLYYDDPYKTEFIANVIKKDGSWVILDKTLFYPEGGGQPNDTGFLNNIKVIDVKKVSGVILHKLEDTKNIPKAVNGKINWDRRKQLMQMHSATHLVAGSARKILGPHIWQHGAQKSVDRSRIDLTHFDRLTEEETDKIEDLANSVIKKGLKINADFMERNDAEKRYGFVLYQGGASPGKNVRVVKIQGIDVEACGGTHCTNTKEIEKIVILKTERIQDGVVRIEFSSGKAAEAEETRQKNIIKEACEILGVAEDKLVEATESLLEQWKESKKSVDEKSKQSADSLAEKLSKKFSNNILIEKIEDIRLDELRHLSKKLSGPGKIIILFGISERINVIGSSGNEKVDIGHVVRNVCTFLGGNGGGNKNLGQGIGNSKELIDEAMKIARKDISR